MVKNTEAPIAADPKGIKAEKEALPEAKDTVAERSKQFGASRFEVAERASELIGQGRESYVEMKSDREELNGLEKVRTSGALERQAKDPKAAKAALESLQPHLKGARENIAAKSEIYRSLGLDPDRDLKRGKLSWREQWRFGRAEKKSQAYEKARDNRNVLFGEFVEKAEGLDYKGYKQLKKKLLKADDRLTRAGEKFTGRMAKPADGFRMAEYTPDKLATELPERLKNDFSLTPREGKWAQAKQAKRQEVLKREVSEILKLEHRLSEFNRGFEQAKNQGDVGLLIKSHEGRQWNKQELAWARQLAGNSYERAQRAGKVYELIHRLRERGVDAAKAGINAAKEAWAGKVASMEETADGKSAAIAKDAKEVSEGDSDRMGKLEKRVDVLETGHTELKTKLQSAAIERIAIENHLNPINTKTLEDAAEEIIKGQKEGVAAKEEKTEVLGKTPETGATARREEPGKETAENIKVWKIIKDSRDIRDGLKNDLEGRQDLWRKVASVKPDDWFLRRISKETPEEKINKAKEHFKKVTGSDWKKGEYGINTYIESLLESPKPETQPAPAVERVV